ncbi:MAG: Crp/Fnr family transcriptional regulator [Planctomycetaceae bacterium]
MNDQKNGGSRLGNRLLSALTAEDRGSLAGALEAIALKQGHVLYEPNEPIRYIYFPTDGVVSQTIVMRSGRMVETATVGNEGMLGLPVLLGAKAGRQRVVVQIPGNAVRIEADVFRQAVERSPELRRLFQRFALTVLEQFAQSTACNQLHSAHQRMCRWLLQCHDRMEGDTFPLTQRFLAIMLGVRRATVTEIAGRLQNDGIIRYHRGVITVLDRGRLETESCECYVAVRSDLERLLDVR